MNMPPTGIWWKWIKNVPTSWGNCADGGVCHQELLTLPEHLRSPSAFSGVRVTRSLVLYVCFVDRCLSFCTFSFGHCVVCSSSICEFWLPLWYLQTILTRMCPLVHFDLFSCGRGEFFVADLFSWILFTIKG